jgi:flagellar L-ring protein precursor FlgH
MPMPKEQALYSNPNSLWQPGAKGFFKDQRASKVGDILTVNIAIKDSATVNSSSALKRGNDSDSLSIGTLGGFEKYIKKNLPEGADLTNLVDIDSSKSNSGSGTTGRNETINLTLSAIITQVLPNGNLVIEGTQEVRVNYELRQLQLNGVIRREDISSQNTIESSQVAELRVAYGGRGTVSDLQQPRVGRQILDVILPF